MSTRRLYCDPEVFLPEPRERADGRAARDVSDMKAFRDAMCAIEDPPQDFNRHSWFESDATPDRMVIQSSSQQDRLIDSPADKLHEDREKLTWLHTPAEKSQVRRTSSWPLYGGDPKRHPPYSAKDLARGVRAKGCERLAQHLHDLDINALHLQMLADRETERWEPESGRGSRYLDALKYVLEAHRNPHVPAAKRRVGDPERAVAIHRVEVARDFELSSSYRDQLSSIDRPEHAVTSRGKVAGSSQNVIFEATRDDTRSGLDQSEAKKSLEAAQTRLGESIVFKAFSASKEQPLPGFAPIDDLGRRTYEKCNIPGKEVTSNPKGRTKSIMTLGKKVAHRVSGVAQSLNGGHKGIKQPSAISDVDTLSNRPFQSKREGKRPLGSVEVSEKAILAQNESQTASETFSAREKTEQNLRDGPVQTGDLRRTVSAVRVHQGEGESQIHKIFEQQCMAAEGDVKSLTEYNTSFLVECVCCGDVKSRAADFSPHPPTHSCQHAIQTCRDCMERWLASELAGKGCKDMHCPECLQIMEYQDVRRGASEETKEEYERRLFLTALSEEPEFAWCLVGLLLFHLMIILCADCLIGSQM